MSFRDWLNRYTHNRRIHGLFQATISSLLTVNSHELPAGEYFRVIRTISPLTFGFIDGGSLALWRRFAALVCAAGGEVLTGAPVTRILQHNGCVGGVELRHRQRSCVVRAPLDVSNVGPVATAAMLDPACLDAAWREGVQRMHPTSIIWLHFASEEPVLDYSAIAVGCSRRVNMIDCPSLEVAGVAPPGSFLYTVGAAPLDTLRPTGIDLEYEAVMADLRDIIPDFDRRRRVLTRSCYRGKWPGFRTVPGSRPTHRTPLGNLYNVGDGVGPPGYEGSMGAARSAQLVFEDIERGKSTGAA